MGFHGQIVQKLAGEADSRQRHPSSRAGQQRIIKSAAIPQPLAVPGKCGPRQHDQIHFPRMQFRASRTGFAYAPAARHQFPVMAYTVKTSAFSPHAPAGSTIPGQEANPAGKANPPLPAWRQKQPRAGNSSPAPETTHGGKWNGTWPPGRRHPIRPPFHVSCGALPVWQPPDRLRFRIGMLFLPFQQTF